MTLPVQVPESTSLPRARIAKLRALPTRSIFSAAQRKELLAIEKKWREELT